jgi:serine/threonine protein kinase
LRFEKCGAIRSPALSAVSTSNTSRVAPFRLNVAHSANMGSQSALNINPSDIDIRREISCSKSSAIYEVQLAGKTYAMKLVSTISASKDHAHISVPDNGDQGYTKKGRDLNRFRCELNAYHNLRKFGVCDRGFVPAFHGYIDRIDPSAFFPPLKHFVGDEFRPRAILLEYLPDEERLNCVNYSEDLFRNVVDGIEDIHRAFIHHHDIYPKNMLAVAGDRIVWIDFDVATTFSNIGPRERAYSEYETELG